MRTTGKSGSERILVKNGVGVQSAVRILLGAGLLSAGMAITSLAASGWQEENGTWQFYDKNGDYVTDKWEKSDNSWFYLDKDGLMAIQKLVEADDDYYYVDENGVRVTNKWVQVANTDEYDEDDPDYWWYYFGESGKAYKAPESGKTKLFRINGEDYAFSPEGRMLFGWVDEDSARQTDDDAWSKGLYYMGDAKDGAAAKGWAQIPVVDDNTERWDYRGDESEDQDYWFYFQSNGKKLCSENSDELKYQQINGKKYGFDETGRMVSEWVSTEANKLTYPAITDVIGSGSTGGGSGSSPGSGGGTGSGSGSTGADVNSGSGAPSTNGFNYYGAREEGARLTKGWFKVVPPSNVNAQDSDDEETRWFYASTRGKIVASDFKTIDSKRYAFDNSGRMLSGLQAVYIDSLGRVWNRELDEEDLMKDGTALESGGTTSLVLIDDTGMETKDQITVADAIKNVFEGRDIYGNRKKPEYGVYYFGGPDDGAVRTATQSVSVEGDTYIFYFKKDGGTKGRGINGMKDNYLYQEGKRVKADKDNKYEAYFIADEPQEQNGWIVNDISTGDYQNSYIDYCENTDTTVLPDHIYRVAPGMVNQMVKDIGDGTVKVKGDRIYLVNTSGSIAKNAAKEAKDGDDCYYGVVNGKVVSYYEKDGDNNKVLINPAE